MSIEEKEEIECDYTQDVVCPYCGYKHDYVDFLHDRSESGEEECSECGAIFKWHADFDITFCTEKINKSE